MHPSFAFLVGSILVLSACGDDSRPIIDAGRSDSGVPRDSGAGDAGGSDGGGALDAASCDDDNPCTVDSVGAAGCVNTPGNAGTECRPAAGECDVAETCSGTEAACPADAFEPATTECRPAAGDCDVAESCSGTEAACPVDAFAPDTTECRASAGICDAAELCSGTGADCPEDAFEPATTECRASTTTCDGAEMCTGTGADCPLDIVAPATTVCRPGTSACDAAETCDGTTTVCPPDGPTLTPRLYAATGQDTMSSLLVLNPMTGATATTIGPTGGFALTGLAQHPMTGVLYGVTTPLSPTAPENLVTLNTTTGAATVVGPLGHVVADIAFASDGRCFGWSESDDDLLTIDVATGTATAVADYPDSTRGSGLEFLLDGRLVFAGDDADGPLRVIDPMSGLSASIIGTLTGAGNPVNALTIDPAGVLYGLVNMSGGGGTSLVVIDTSTAALTVRGATITGADALAFACP
jgi:hypothetical protein